MGDTKYLQESVAGCKNYIIIFKKREKFRHAKNARCIGPKSVIFLIVVSRPI